MLPNPDHTKRKILAHLKESCGATTQDLAAALGVTVPAIRKHLVDLEEEQYIAGHLEKRCGKGRPQYVYHLTHKGEEAFPKNYSGLCLDLLGHLESLCGEQMVLQLFSAREESLYQQLAPQLAHLTLDQKVRKLSELLCEAGYQATLTDAGEWLLEQRNCPSIAVARRYKALCQCEMSLYERLLGVPIERVSQIASGAGACRYKITKA